MLQRFQLIIIQYLLIWRMSTVNEIFGDFYVLKLGGGTLGHLWRNVSVATREALEACVQARNEVRNLAHEIGKIICEAR